MKTKRILSVLMALVMVFALLPVLNPPAEAAEDVDIDEGNFPDAVFRSYVSANFDSNHNGVLSASEIASVKTINVDSKGIGTLSGVEYFTALQTLSCSGNQMEYMDASFLGSLTSLTAENNPKLQALYCAADALTSLSVKGCTALQELVCFSNALTALDLSSCPSLYSLDCSYNALVNLDVSKCTHLESLNCRKNRLTSLNVNNTALSSLDCSGNRFSALDLSQSASLVRLSCYGNRIAALDISPCEELVYAYLDGEVTEHTDEDDLTYYSYDGWLCVDTDTVIHYAETLPVDSDHFPDTAFRTYVSSTLDQDSDGGLTPAELADVTEIDVRYKGITSLKGIEYFTNLKKLYCDGNQLSSLDVSQNTALESLLCYGNPLTSLNVTKNTALTVLDVRDCQLTSLDVTQNAALENLYCPNNQLGTLDITNNPLLRNLWCYGNAITQLSISENPCLLDAFLNGEPTVYDDDGTYLGYDLEEENNYYLYVDVDTVVRTIPTSGLCGSSVFWILNDGVLTISGTGAMDDYNTVPELPWKSLRDEIRSIVIESGVTGIGKNAFYGCDALTEVSLPDSLIQIGLYAFQSCPALPEITIPASVAILEAAAFDGCFALKRITFEGSAPTFGSSTFRRVSATAFYPGNDATWTADVQQDYGGTITWQALTKPVITTQPSNKTVAAGAKATFTVAATGNDLSYQWQYKTSGSSAWKNKAGATSASYTVTAKESYNGMLYRCMVTNAMGSATSNSAKLTVTVTETAPAITTQPTAQTAAAGETATFKVVATGGNLKYQWQYSTDYGKTWHDKAGSTKATHTVTVKASYNGYLYRCVITNSKGTVTSSKVRLTVSGVKPKILSQPAAASAAAGESVTFKVVAAGVGMTYQWQYKTAGSSTWKDKSGATSASYTVMAKESYNGIQYRCKVTNSIGYVYSDGAALTVTSAVTAPEITTQPKAQTAAAGETATFKVVASGSGLTYQWQYSSDYGKTWHDKAGSTKTTHTVTVKASYNGYLYRCKVTNSAGTVYSSKVRLTVSGVKPKILSQPAAKTAAAGESVTFKVVAAGVGMTYQWQYSTNGGKTWKNKSGATSASYTVTAKESYNGIQYRCVVTNSIGSVTSTSATLTVS